MGLVALDDLMVVCLPFDPRFAGSNPAEDDRFLRAIKIRNTASFRGEVKLSLQSLKILQHVKDPYEYENDTSKAKFCDNFLQSFSCFATRCFCWQLPDNSGGRIRSD
jgi:hypothetical protein